VPFWGFYDGRKHLGGQLPPKHRQNWALICSAERLSCASMKIDFIEEWRHFRVAALSTNFRQSLPNTVIYCQTAVKMSNHCTHPHWPKQTTYALMCTFSSI